MGKFGCSCGNAISLNSIPKLNQAWLITDIALDNTAGEKIPANNQPKREVIECDACGRLWVQAQPEGERSKEWISFKPEGKKRLKFRDDYGKSYRHASSPDADEKEDLRPFTESLRKVILGFTTVLQPLERGHVITVTTQSQFSANRLLIPKLRGKSMPVAVNQLTVDGQSQFPAGVNAPAEIFTKALTFHQTSWGKTIRLTVSNLSKKKFKFRAGIVGMRLTRQRRSSPRR